MSAPIDPTSAAAIAATPALAMAGTASPLWLIAVAAAAGAVVWTLAQKPTEFWSALSMMATGTFFGIVASKTLPLWAKSVESFKWIADVDGEYIAAVFGLAGNLLFSFGASRLKKEGEK